MTTTVQIVALSAAILMLLGGGFIVFRRTTGLGPSTIQALGLVLLVPTILILAVTNALSKEILATLLGGVAGYISAALRLATALIASADGSPLLERDRC